MSVWIVSENHITAILQACLNNGLETGHNVAWEGDTGYKHSVRWCQLDHTVADAVGRMLWEANVASFRARYEGRHEEDLPDASIYQYPAFPGRAPTVVEALKQIDCLEYQSDETPDWETSEACRFLEAARRTLIHSLPGYDAAPWGWEDSRAVAA